MLSSTPEAHLDAVCRTACALFGVPIALVNLVRADTFAPKAGTGIDLGAAFPRAGAFCDRTLRGSPGTVLVLADLLSDPDFAGTPLVTGPPHARFYAGVPLVLSDGLPLGTLCLIDRVPRTDFDAACTDRLRDLGTIVEAHLRLAAAQQAQEVE